METTDITFKMSYFFFQRWRVTREIDMSRWMRPEIPDHFLLIWQTIFQSMIYVYDDILVCMCVLGAETCAASDVKI